MNQLPSRDSPQGFVPAVLAPAFSPRGPVHIDSPDNLKPIDAPPGGLLEYWRIVQRRAGTTIFIAVLGMVGGFLYTVPQTPIYQAKTTIEIQGLNEDFMHMRDVNPNAGGSSGWDPTIDIQTQVKILQSRSLLDRVRKKLLAETKPIPVLPTRLGAWRSILHMAPSQLASGREGAVNAAAGGIHARSQTNTRLIEIMCDSSSPQIAADFANALASEFIEQNLDARWQATQHTGEWLARQMEDVKIKLEQSDDALQAYARAVNLVMTDEKDNASDVKLKQLQEELSRVQADRVTRQADYELAIRASADSLGEMLDDRSLQDTQAKLTDLRRQLAELSSSFTPDHPRVKKVQAQVAELESAVQAKRLNILGRIRNDYESAERREKLLSTEFDVTSKIVASQAEKVSHYNILKREVDTNRQLYDSMLQRVKEAGIASALRASNIRVVDPAVVPGAPYKPSFTDNTVLGLVVGILFGVALVVILDRADRTVKEPGDVSFYLGSPELGIILSASADPTRKYSDRPLGGILMAGSSRSMALVTLNAKSTPIAESFRATLTSILFAGDHGEQLRIIVFSSASPREGKTTVTTNLAVALAEIHKRVLLIDADLRRPNIHRFFGLDNNIGFVDLLRSRVPIVDSLNGQARKTDVPNLTVMTTGKSVDGAPLLLHSSRLEEVLNLARDEYDMVLIDTPPMLNMSDARLIARHADGVVLIARANATSRNAVRDAYRRFVEDGTRVIGTVLNDWNPKKSSHYGYYRYYNKYKHYYAGTKGKPSIKDAPGTKGDPPALGGDPSSWLADE